MLALNSIELNGTATDKAGAIKEAGDLLVASGNVYPSYVDSMYERERSVSTYMGNLLAIPHGTNETKEAILASALSVVRYDGGVDWGGEPVTFVMGIAGVGDEHLEILSQIALLFSDDDEVAKLKAAQTPEELLSLLATVNES